MLFNLILNFSYKGCRYAAFSYFSAMFRKLILSVASLFIIFSTYAQQDSSHLRISLLTCGTGDETWETFGHTAIRVTDSVAGTDIVFNYGTFEFSNDFAMQFARGKLLYYLSFYGYNLFLDEYQSANRSVREQVLMLSGEKKKEFYAFLKENAKEENRYYKYDFFYDNCATRIRDIFPRTLGSGFRFGTTIAGERKLSFRSIINRYYYYKHWERFGVNLLLGSPIDSTMTNEDIMFLPDYLSNGVEHGSLNGEKISTPTHPVVAGSPARPVGLNEPFVVMCLIALLTIIGLSVPSLRILGNIMTFLVLLATGLLGCIMIVMWLGTDHQACRYNYNLLWALPVNLFLAVLPKRKKSKYAIVAIILLLLALIFHIFKVQEMPLLELFPLLLSLLFIYGRIYRKSNSKHDGGAAIRAN